jgi:hypothetical protein
VTAYEEPPVVELEELLDEQEDQPSARPIGQIVLILALAAVGLVAVTILATMYIPAAADFVQWITLLIRRINA